MGIDVRAYGGYAIWWPAAGFEILCDEPPTLWPQWVVDALQRSPAVTPGVSRARVPEARSLAGLVRRVATAREGERNCLTFWAGCRAGEMVGSGMLDVGAAIAVIAEAATRAGLPRDEAERTAASGVRTGLGASHDW